MLLWLLIIVSVVLFLLYFIFDFDIYYFLAIISAMFASLCISFAVPNHIAVDEQVLAKQEEYKALVYEVENSTFREEDEIVNKIVFDEVRAWNKDIVFKKSIQKDFWFGVFYPDIYDQFETIDYEEFSKE